jgi:hypothetical protein
VKEHPVGQERDLALPAQPDQQDRDQRDPLRIAFDERTVEDRFHHQRQRGFRGCDADHAKDRTAEDQGVRPDEAEQAAVQRDTVDGRRTGGRILRRSHGREDS